RIVVPYTRWCRGVIALPSVPILRRIWVTGNELGRSPEVIMRNRAAILAAAAGLLPALLGVLPPMAAAAASDAPGAPAASGALAPSEDGVFVFLTGTVALSPSDAWAVGFGGIGGTGFLSSQVLHWNGHQWVSVKILPR